MASLAQLTRAHKFEITKTIVTNLEARRAAGPPEPALDGYVATLTPIRDALGTHVTGKSTASAARDALGVASDKADDGVDRWYRHVYHYLDVEALRRFGPAHTAAGALLAAAFPEGLEHIDERIPDENTHCRASIAVLRDPTHAATLTAMEFPAGWLDGFEAAVGVSDAAVTAVDAARTQGTTAVALGRDAEEDFAVQMRLLRKYVESRATPTDTARIAEGRELLRPLLGAVKAARVEAAARKTRKTHGTVTTEPAPGGAPTAGAAAGTTKPTG